MSGCKSDTNHTACIKPLWKQGLLPAGKSSFFPIPAASRQKSCNPDSDKTHTKMFKSQQ